MKKWLASLLIAICTVCITVGIIIPLYMIMLMVGLALFHFRILKFIVHVLIEGLLGRYA